MSRRRGSNAGCAVCQLMCGSAAVWIRMLEPVNNKSGPLACRAGAAGGFFDLYTAARLARPLFLAPSHPLTATPRVSRTSPRRQRAHAMNTYARRERRESGWLMRAAGAAAARATQRRRCGSPGGERAARAARPAAFAGAHRSRRAPPSPRDSATCLPHPELARNPITPIAPAPAPAPAPARMPPAAPSAGPAIVPPIPANSLAPNPAPGEPPGPAPNGSRPLAPGWSMAPPACCGRRSSHEFMITNDPDTIITASACAPLPVSTTTGQLPPIIYVSTRLRSFHPAEDPRQGHREPTTHEKKRQKNDDENCSLLASIAALVE